MKRLRVFQKLACFEWGEIKVSRILDVRKAPSIKGSIGR